MFNRKTILAVAVSSALSAVSLASNADTVFAGQEVDLSITSVEFSSSGPADVSIALGDFLSVNGFDIEVEDDDLDSDGSDIHDSDDEDDEVDAEDESDEMDDDEGEDEADDDPDSDEDDSEDADEETEGEESDEGDADEGDELALRHPPATGEGGAMNDYHCFLQRLWVASADADPCTKCYVRWIHPASANTGRSGAALLQ